MIGIAYFYVEQGKPWWREATKALIRSARETQPGCEITHMSDKATGQQRGTDNGMIADEAIGNERLMMAKGWMWATHSQMVERNTVLCDADMEFRRSMAPLFNGDWDVGLLHRQEGGRAKGMPFLAAMALTKPTDGARRFWGEYLSVMQSLPKAWAAWWCDQVAFSILLGVTRVGEGTMKYDGYTVKLFDAELLAPHIPTPDCYAVHFKGRHTEKNAA